MHHWLLLLVAATLGGAINSVAGGGSFLTFPALLLSGVPAIAANATSTVALWPGSVASATAYRRELAKAPHAGVLTAVSLVGGALGAWLLLKTPQATFVHLIPYLLGAATLLFAFGPTLTRRLRAARPSGAPGPAGLSTMQLFIAAYGGFFGGGIGILMLAAFGLAGIEDVHVMNALKTVLAATINGIAVVLFVSAGKVFWPQALLMLTGAIVGGYAGAAGARRVDPRVIRRVVIAVGCAMTVYFSVHA